MGTVARDLLDLAKAFPFDIGDTKGVFPDFNRLHWHDSLEINYVKHGEGMYLINGTTYPIRQGDIVLLSPSDLHRAFETRDLVLQVTVFDSALLAADQRYDPELLAPFVEMGLRFGNVLDRDHPRMNELRAILMDMQEEHETQSSSYRTIIRAQMARFLAYVNRHFSRSASPASIETRSKQPLVRSVLEAVHQDPARPWSLREMADLIHLSPSRFSAIFKQIVGMSPLNYCIEIRLGQAVHLLETTDRKIIDIAAECGFRNLSNFNRVFVQHVGKTPSQVRGQQ
ncbi:helix-turn-helix domain-containing protein [Cohnella sp. GCM10020058]|uniref:helix-turn-helix domain-containing protein n=1 Tax=Cohnella sp. GCM10020058 TaxID=3317330 RepID=UPI0036438704